MNSLCSHNVVAEELIQKDDLLLLFVGASSSCLVEQTIWRDAIFTFLCTIVGKSLSPSIIKYIHHKNCVNRYVTNLQSHDFNNSEKIAFICNIMDFLRSSADTTPIFIEDFAQSGGFEIVTNCCIS